MIDAEVLSSLVAVDALACTIYGESRGEAVEGQIAVGCVVRNRVRAALSQLKSSDYTAICFAPFQFSCWHPRGGQANYNDTMAAARSLVSVKAAGVLGAASKNVLRQCLWIAQGLISGALRDSVRGATSYHASYMDPFPAWAAKMVKVATVGHHIFYQEPTKAAA